MPVIITVGLLGQPGPDVYEKLRVLMQETLGWESQVTGSNGVVAPLPGMVFAGETQRQLIDLADNLLSQISADVWSHGAKVFVVRWLDWAGVGTA